MRNHIRTVTGAAALVALTVLTACSSSGGPSASTGTPPASGPASGTADSPASVTSYPITVHASNGTVTIPARPKSIVVLSPTATEMLFAMDAGSQVKAVDKDSDYPADAPHTKLDPVEVNIESIASYRPDLVVASNLSTSQVRQLTTLHIPTLVEPAAARLTDAYAEIATLGQVTGHPAEAAAEVATMKRGIAAVVNNVGPKAKSATYYYELDQTYYSETSSTFIGQVLGLLGLKSIADAAKGAASSGGYPQLNAEFILKANPDYVFLADTLCCKQTAATVAKRPGWSTLGAVRGGRVVELSDDIASRWGPRVVDLLRTVGQAIRQHPAT